MSSYFEVFVLWAEGLLPSPDNTPPAMFGGGLPPPPHPPPAILAGLRPSNSPLKRPLDHLARMVATIEGILPHASVKFQKGS